MAAPLAAVPDPHDEPIVDDVEGLIMPDDVRWPLAYRLREMKVEMQATQAGLSRALGRITAMQTEAKDTAALTRAEHPKVTEAEACIHEWRKTSGHRGAKVTPERVDMTLKRFDEGYEPVNLLEAAHGLPGHVYKGNDDYKVIAGSGTQVERYANFCPPEKRRELRGQLFA